MGRPALFALLGLFSVSALAEDLGVSVCRDARALNESLSTNTSLPENRKHACKYPVVRVEHNKWWDLQTYCQAANYPATPVDMGFCYQMQLGFLPPWPRKYNMDCSNPNMCTLPLQVEVVNLMVDQFKFNAEEQTVKLSVTYGLRWKDERLFPTMIFDPNMPWAPSMQMDLYLMDKGQFRLLPLLSTYEDSDSLQMYIEPPPCTETDLKLMADGQAQGCCDGPNCGGAQAANNFLWCPDLDRCEILRIRRQNIIVRLPDLSFTSFPYDKHQIQAALYMVNPYYSTDPQWWKLWRPKPPRVIFRDIGSDKAPWEGSLKYSLDRLDTLEFSMQTRVVPEDSPSLVYLMGQGTDEAYDLITTGQHFLGVGGLVLDIFLYRQNTFVVRFYIFPIVITTVTACLCPILNDDAVAQVGPRVGLSSVAILTALASSYDLTSITATAEQLTAVDALSILSIVFGGLVSAETLLSYAWWRKHDCLSYETWTCWFVQAMDFGMAVLFTSVYLFLVGLLLLIPQSMTAAIVWAVLGFLVMAVINGVAFMAIRRWAAIAKVKPEYPEDDEEDDPESPALRRFSARTPTGVKPRQSIPYDSHMSIRKPKPRSSIGGGSMSTQDSMSPNYREKDEDVDSGIDEDQVLDVDTRAKPRSSFSPGPSPTQAQSSPSRSPSPSVESRVPRPGSAQLRGNR